MSELSYQEQVVGFGREQSLLGILTKPERLDLNRPAVIILNSGALHRVGACRRSVLLARSCAEQGFVSLRFDFSGIGDSGFNSEQGDLEQANIEDLQAAMEVLSAQGVEKFIVHGLCSGARSALLAAEREPRIVGLSQIDSHAYPTVQFYWRRIKPKLLSVRAWLNAAKSRLARPEEPQNADLQVQAWPEYAPKSEIEEVYQKLAERKVKLLVTYTGSWRSEYNYSEQFCDMYKGVDFDDLLKLHLMSEADHIFSQQQDWLIYQAYFNDFLQQFA